MNYLKVFGSIQQKLATLPWNWQ